MKGNPIPAGAVLERLFDGCTLAEGPAADSELRTLYIAASTSLYAIELNIPDQLVYPTA